MSRSLDQRKSFAAILLKSDELCNEDWVYSAACRNTAQFWPSHCFIQQGDAVFRTVVTPTPHQCTSGGRGQGSEVMLWAAFPAACSQTWMRVLSLELNLMSSCWRRPLSSVCLCVCLALAAVSSCVTLLHFYQPCVFMGLFCAVGCDHRWPGRRHGHHPRVRAHLPAAWTAPSADPDCALHGKSWNRPQYTLPLSAGKSH